MPLNPLARCLAGAALVASAVIVGPSQAAAAMCGTHDSVKKLLVDRYEESSRGLGLVSDQGIVELYTSDKGTWSILMTTSEGRTCVIAAGHTWQEFEVALDEPSA
jgi:hypothetical protein